MWSQWPCVSSTRRTPRRSHSSRRRSCSLAASRSTASPVSVQRSTSTLLSTGPTTTWWISTPVASQISVSAMLSSVCLGSGTSTTSTGGSSSSPSRPSARCSSSRSTCSRTRRWSVASAPRRSAGLALASVVLNTLVWVFNFLSYGTTVRVAVRRGRGRPRRRGQRRAAGPVARGRASGWWWRSAIGLHAPSGWCRCIGDDPAVIAEGVTYLRVSVVGVPVPVRGDRVHRVPLRPARHPAARSSCWPCRRRPTSVLELLLVFGLDWGIAGSAWGTVFAQMLSAGDLPGHRRAQPAGRRAPPPQRGAVGDVGGAQGRRPPRAAHRVPAGRAGGGHRGRQPGRHRPSWPATRSPPSCSSSWPSASTCSRCRASRWSATPSARAGPTRRRTSCGTSTAGPGAPAVLLTVVTLALSPGAPAPLHRRSRRGARRHHRPRGAGGDAAAGRADLRARRRADGRQRLPRPPVADDRSPSPPASRCSWPSARGRRSGSSPCGSACWCGSRSARSRTTPASRATAG